MKTNEQLQARLTKVLKMATSNGLDPVELLETLRAELAVGVPAEGIQQRHDSIPTANFRSVEQLRAFPAHAHQ